jgi:xanthine dehydrogenase small subunit
VEANCPEKILSEILTHHGPQYVRITTEGSIFDENAAGAVKFIMASAGVGFEFVLNGKPVRESSIAAQTTLLDYIRGRGLTGAKEGCAEGECGACAVLFIHAGVNGAACQSVNSCLVPLPAAAGREIYTVEALQEVGAEPGRLADAQRAMAERGGSQCGYCTPGFVVSMFAQQQSGPVEEFAQSDLGGNLCRCTGYRPIRDAMRSLGPPGDTPMRRRLALPVAPVLPFDYQFSGGRFSRPGSLSECLELAARNQNARFVAGNTDLGVITNLRQERFAHLISLDGVPELREFHESAESIEIGAGLTLTEIEERWNQAPGLFYDWLRLFASPLIRNRATLGGNLSTASPIGDAAPMLLALDADVRIAGAADERVVPLHAFFREYRKTDMGPGEILRSVRIPKPLPSFVRFYKVAKRRVDDISTVAAGISVRSDRSGRITSARIALGGVGPMPLRAFEAEEAIIGSRVGARVGDVELERAKEMLRRTLHPMSDHRGSAAYRLAMAQRLLEKFFWSQR